MIRRHKFYRRSAQAGVVFVELATQLAYWFVGIQQCSGCMSAQSDNNLRLYYLNLSLQIRQTVYYLVRTWVAIVRRTAL